MDEEQEKVWERLKYVKPATPKLDSIEALRRSFMAMGRSHSKTTLAMQSFGRALRKKDEQSGL